MAKPFIYWTISPRVIEILDPDTDISIQELHNDVTTEEMLQANLSFERLITTTGKQELGDGEYVGLTTRLLNGVIAFSPKTTSKEEGTVTTPDTDGVVLYDSAAQFETNGVLPGATVVNFTDKSVTSVISVDSEYQLTCWPLGDGSDNQFDSADEYKVWNEVQCEVSAGNLTSVDELGDSTSAILPTFGTQIVVSRDTTAALIDPQFLDKLVAEHRISGSVAEYLRRILYRAQ